MTISGDADNEPRNRRFHTGDILDSGGTLTFDIQRSKPSGFAEGAKYDVTDSVNYISGVLVGGKW